MSTRKPPPKRDDPEQSKRFEETARELEADESGGTFDRAMKAVVPAPKDNHPSKPVKQKPSSRSQG